MAAEILFAASITLAGTDLSDHFTDITLDASYEQVDDTAFGDTFRSRVIGLQDGQVSGTYHMDYAASSTYATISAIAGTAAAMVLKKNSGAVATTNPSFSFSALITDWTPIDASVGALHTNSFSWPLTTAITIATA